MPTADVGGVKLDYEEAGQGTPLLFVHEFAGDGQSWRPQVRFFSRRYRTITFNARGYPPSDVPEDPRAYSQRQAVDDVRGVLDHLGISRAHVCGLSMGGYATLPFGPHHPPPPPPPPRAAPAPGRGGLRPGGGGGGGAAGRGGAGAARAALLRRRFET